MTETTTRVVPIVMSEDVHIAEGTFFERHPGTEALIADWEKNVNTLVLGTDPYDNIVHQR